MRPPLLLSALLVALLWSCTENVPPPNPISGGLDAPAGGPAGGKDPTGTGPSAPDWKSVGQVQIPDTGLAATVATGLDCCGDAKAPYQGSPARFYLGPADMAGGGDGLLLWLDATGHSVLSRQTDPGVYSEVIYRSEKPAERSDGIVHLESPAALIPTVPLYIWAGTRFPSTVLGRDLPVSDPEGKIPALLIAPPSAGPDPTVPGTP